MYTQSRITDAARSIQARLQAQRALVEQDKLEINPAYSSQVFLYIERLLCQNYLPEEQIEENVCEIYLGSALTRLENFLPESAGKMEKALIVLLKKKIGDRWDELDRKADLEMEGDRILEELLSTPGPSEPSPTKPKTQAKKPKRTNKVSKFDRERLVFSRKLQDLKKAAVRLSRQETQEIKERDEVEEAQNIQEIQEDLADANEHIRRLRKEHARLMARIAELSVSKN